MKCQHFDACADAGHASVFCLIDCERKFDSCAHRPDRTEKEEKCLRDKVERLTGEVDRLTAERDAARGVLRKLCTGRKCTEGDNCPLGSYFDCIVPELLLDNTKGGAGQ